MKGHKTSYLSTRGVKFLIALPLLLAAFALLLQVRDLFIQDIRRAAVSTHISEGPSIEPAPNVLGTGSKPRKRPFLSRAITKAVQYMRH